MTDSTRRLYIAELRFLHEQHCTRTGHYHFLVRTPYSAGADALEAMLNKESP